MNFDLRNGDCVELMRAMPANSVDSIVTDPPYELGFMGKSWDSTGIANSVRMWDEALRVLKPGGYLLSFGGSRTYHRMACAIEDAGFQIRDQIMWVYGSGFPKSLNVSKAIDKAAGLDREVLSETVNRSTFDLEQNGGSEFQSGTIQTTSPTTDKAKQWAGWGTALKPAHEPIVMARKPLSESTVAKNVLKHGTGGINIESARVPSDDGFEKAWDKPVSTNISADGPGYISEGARHIVDLGDYKPSGRFPANFIHDGLYEDWARYFYCPKTSKKDRNEGLGLDRNRLFANNHPTVKPTDLMRYLVRLVTPPNGTVLDPFTGSGSTGKASVLEGFNFIGCELDPEYIAIANARMNHALEQQQGKLL